MSLVLIIDDEQSFLTAMELALGSAGHETVCAQSGEEGLARLRERRPNLIFLDIMMPGIGGLETLNVLRSAPDLKSIPVVMVSGVRPRLPVSEQKWDEFLSKPFSLAEALKVIAKYEK